MTEDPRAPRIELRFPASAPEAVHFPDDVVHARAGAVPRPPLEVDARAIAPIAEQLVRVLDESGRAQGPWAGVLSREDLERGLFDMKLVRAFDARMLRAHRQGKTSFYMQCLGEEAIGCAHRRALRDDDMTFPTYRQQGLLIASGYPIVDMMNQVFSNSRDPLLGRQLPVMYSSKAHGFFSISGNLGTQFVQAVGWAMASAIAGDDRIASAWIGEGATAETDFHSGLLFASVYRAPVILNVVNNQWAISTHEDVARGSSPSFAARGLGYGIPSLRVDGNDYLAVHAASQWAAHRAREGHGPCLVEWVTYRVGAHSTSDDPRVYRDGDEASRWPLGDPVERLTRHLEVEYDREKDADEEQSRLANELVDAALVEAEAAGTAREGPRGDPSTMFDDVFAEPTAQLLEQRREALL